MSHLELTERELDAYSKLLCSYGLIAKIIITDDISIETKYSDEDDYDFSSPHARVYIKAYIFIKTNFDYGTRQDLENIVVTALEQKILERV